jgi:hypothetical protein
MSETYSFDAYSKLPEHLVATSKQVMKFAGHYVKIEGDSKSFDWQGFHQSVNNYRGDELTFDKLKDNTINQSEATVTVMVEKIVAFLKTVLNVVLSAADVASLTANIEATFTNLEVAYNEGFASFSKSSSSYNSSWEYRIVFAMPNPDLVNDFYSLVTTIELTADIKEKSSWWGLVGSTKKNFGAHITAMQLVVTKGFRDPHSV